MGSSLWGKLQERWAPQPQRAKNTEQVAHRKHKFLEWEAEILGQCPHAGQNWLGWICQNWEVGGQWRTEDNYKNSEGAAKVPPNPFSLVVRGILFFFHYWEKFKTLLKKWHSIYCQFAPKISWIISPDGLWKALAETCTYWHDEI